MRVLVHRGRELRFADLAEQAEELAPECALRVAACELVRDLEAGEVRRALVEVGRERRRRVRHHDGRRERRAHDGSPNAREHRLEWNVRQLRELSQGGRADGRRLPALRVAAAEGADVCCDRDAPRRSRERAALRVDDRSARPGNVDRTERLLGRERRVLRAVQHLDRPRAQQQHAERGRDQDGEPADAHIEPTAVEVRRVGPRIRPDPPRVGEGARELAPALRIGGRDGYGGCGWRCSIGG